MSKQIQNQKNNPDQLVAQVQTFSSPYPMPVQMECYEKLCPGIGQRILETSIDAVQHNLKMSEYQIKAGVRFEFMRLIGALFVVLVILCGSFWMVYKNGDLKSYATLIGSVAAVIAALLYSIKR